MLVETPLLLKVRRTGPALNVLRPNMLIGPSRLGSLSADHDTVSADDGTRGSPKRKGALPAFKGIARVVLR